MRTIVLTTAPLLPVGRSHDRVFGGTTPAFGDYRCRAGRTGLCRGNHTHRFGVRFDTTGIEPFGCLPEVPPDGAGTLSRC